MKVLEFEGRSSGIDVASQPGDHQRGREVLSPRGVPSIIDGVIKIGAHDGTGYDAAQSRRTCQPTKIDSLKKGLGCRIERLHAAIGVAVGETDARESAPQRIAGKHRKTRGILLKILRVVLAIGRALERCGIDPVSIS